jgi:hypothetical protein
MELGAHEMTDDELFFHLSVYGDTNCPAPDDTHRRFFEFADTAPLLRADGWVAKPTQATDYVVGQAVRFDDTVLFSKRSRSGLRETFAARVLAILPAVDRGVFLATPTPHEVGNFCGKWTWLDTKEGEVQRMVPASAFQAHEQQILAVKRGPMWNSTSTWRLALG